MSQKKRVQVQLPPDVFNLVHELSDLGGVSMGSLLAELIIENKQGLEMIRDAILAAKNQDLSSAMDKIQATVLDAMGKGVDLNKEINETRSKNNKK